MLAENHYRLGILFNLLLQFTKLIKSNISAVRYNLSSAPMEFINNLDVNKKMGEHGVNILPITVVDDEIVLTGRYPSNDELIEFLDLSPGFFMD
ncbi:arsenic metallochaperone ArsD family protein [Pseudomonas proteolytica]|uniref:arsenic metallochaperone ArsD family protein n=1 Tax=Pseudomonas proteolytica TaxID=219574 RepID=UPI003F665CAC